MTKNALAPFPSDLVDALVIILRIERENPATLSPIITACVYRGGNIPARP